jgi:hypothetical protein
VDWEVAASIPNIAPSSVIEDIDRQGDQPPGIWSNQGHLSEGLGLLLYGCRTRWDLVIPRVVVPESGDKCNFINQGRLARDMFGICRASPINWIGELPGTAPAAIPEREMILGRRNEKGLSRN